MGKKRTNQKRERLPSYRLHKPTGQAVCTLAGKDHYLGKHGTPASEKKYRSLLAQWLAGDKQPIRPAAAAAEEDDALTVAELVLRFKAFAEKNYRRKDGTQTTEPRVFTLALKPVVERFGALAVDQFGPVALRAVRQTFIASGMKRSTVNHLAFKIRRTFRWGCSHQLVKAETVVALATVDGLQRGRCDAVEPEPTRPAPDAWIETLKPRLRPMVRAMVTIQRATGCRAGELCQLRPCDLDKEGDDLWWFTPRQSKSEHKGFERRIALGPKAIEALKPWLDGRKASDVVFRQVRGGPMITTSYAQEIKQACAQDEPIEYYRPHSFRYSRIIELRKTMGLDVAAATAGHATVKESQHYSRIKSESAAQAARESG